MNNKTAFVKLNQSIIDILIFIFSFYAAFFIRFEGIPIDFHLKQLTLFFPFIAISRLLSFLLFSTYSIAWRYISIFDVVSILKACTPVSLVLLFIRIVLPSRFALFRLPLSVIAIEFLLVSFGTLGVRMTRRLVNELIDREKHESNLGDNKKRKILLIGAGDAGNMVAKELLRHKDLGYEIAGFIDDDPHKYRTNIQRKEVLGNTTQLPQIVKKLNISEAIITIANASSKEIRRIVEVCEGIRIKVKIIPGLYEMLDEKIKINKIRDINIDDLLGRNVVSFENHLPRIIQHYKNRTVMITGAGGSIGSELCRQLSKLWPKELILLDKDENSIYEIDFELQSNFETQKVHPLVVDIRNQERLGYIFEKYRPDVVFHAAAHKHVPLMEYNIGEAILNNAVGTRNMAQLAEQFNTKNFIYISTDKAVKPTSVMGATKKIGEILIQEIAARSKTKFSCVRFGNVLGSRGSVVPLFQKQIAQGGPITITHPEMRRYFMSIFEAVQLIIQAGTIGDKGEIFVLDMGEPIKIQELAKDLIKLSGYAEDDFEIRHIGIRPGEKLFEEILVDEERTLATHFKKIFIAPPIEIDGQKFSKNLGLLLKAAQECDETKIRELLKTMDIGYRCENAEENAILGLPS